MKFKKLEVFGFKSFADKLEVKFSEGITAIVGPNGCGKSNVADSIRWVLGEQSAKLLRGHSMQDVIFNGTENRKSLSFCEVSLVFDNRTKLFPSVDYDEVVISRKLYRSGESEYLINKNSCRLKDITDLLRDGGMGREGYSIIGQGRIDELLSAKPEDRRAIFEEAAGISKFKARKIEAERKLLRTRDNMERINDILTEKARLLEPLTRQSEAARKWLEYRDKLKAAEINAYIYQYESASHAKEVINNRLNGVMEEISLRERSRDDATRRYNRATAERNNLDVEIEKLREELLTRTVGLEKQAGEVKLLGERLGYLHKQNERIDEENKEINAEYKATLEYIESGKMMRSDKQNELNEDRRLTEENREKYFEIVDELTAGEDEVEANHRAVIEAMDRLTDIKTNMSRLEAEKSALGSNIVEFEGRLAAAEEKRSAAAQKLEAVQQQVDELTKKRGELSERLKKSLSEAETLDIKLKDLTKDLESLSIKLHTVKTRHKMLTEMREAFEGYMHSVKNLLRDAKGDKSLSGRIEGVVAQVIKVEPELETAIEMALGSAMQNIITRDEDDAKYLIEYLKKARHGRITFLPMTAIKPRSLDRSVQPFLRTAGCLGVASDLISYDKKYDTVMRGLLGSTVIVDNMDTAVELARKSGYSFKIVTKDGDIINPHGSITGGSKKSEVANLFSHDRELIEATKMSEDLTKRTDELTARKNAAEADKKRISDVIAADKDEFHNFDVEIAAKTETAAKLSAEVETLVSEMSEVTEKRDAAAGRVKEIEDDLGSVAGLEELITMKKVSVGANERERQQHFETLRKDRDKYHDLYTQHELNAGKLETEIVSIDNEIKRLQGNVQTLADKLDHNNKQIADNNVLIDNIDKEIAAKTAISSGNDSTDVSQIRAKLAEYDEHKVTLQETLASADSERVELFEEISRLNEVKSREEMMLLKVDTDIEAMQQRIMEEYELEYEGCLPFREENFNFEAGMADINKLKRQMNALGHINLDSIEQSKELFESYHEMDVQREDLVKAEIDLVAIIKELSDEMLERFSGQFEQIRYNFTKIFHELFSGGTADLVLLDSENPLEAGIEIVAQPPEKKLQSISLLSGGERALTAIAILFAILKLRPMPFCVLDEIEAALDDANAKRFAQYLRRFSEDTQFIVITHRKPTMELADNLYGVTMEEKGVSKIVSVKLSDAVASAELS